MPGDEFLRPYILDLCIVYTIGMNGSHNLPDLILYCTKLHSNINSPVATNIHNCIAVSRSCSHYRVCIVTVGEYQWISYAFLTCIKCVYICNSLEIVKKCNTPHTMHASLTLPVFHSLVKTIDNASLIICHQMTGQAQFKF